MAEPRISVGWAVETGIQRASEGKVEGKIYKHATAEQLGISISKRKVSVARAEAITAAVEAASRKQGKYGGRKYEIKWNGARMLKVMELEFSKRLRVASQLVKDQVKRNLSKPVLKYESPKTERIVVLRESRSKPGEFPRQETSTLMRDIFSELVAPDAAGLRKAVVGTTLGYGLRLETKMRRSFLRRTLNEMLPTVQRILLKKML